MNEDWEHQDEAIFIELYAETEEDLVDTLMSDYSMSELKIIARALSRVINNKVNGSPLFGKHYQPKETKSEPKWEDLGYSTSFSIEQTITVDETMNNKEWIWDKAMRNSLDCCANVPKKGLRAQECAKSTATEVAPISGWQLCVNSIKESSMESDMNYNTTTTTDYGFAETRKYLLNRLSLLEGEKYGEAEAKYLPTTKPPKNGKELREYIANGWIVTKVPDDTQFNWDSPLHYMEFQDPSKPRDQDAYEKATGLIAKGKIEAKDAIMVLPQAEGLAALKAFETTTYH